MHKFDEQPASLNCYLQKYSLLRLRIECKGMIEKEKVKDRKKKIRFILYILYIYIIYIIKYKYLLLLF